MNTYKLIIGSAFLAFSLGNAANAQTNTELFGQNRIQSRNFDWKYFESNGLKVYFYDRAGVELSRYIVEQMEKDLNFIQKRMGDIFPKGIDVVVYNSYDDYQQTNIGLASNNNIHNNNAGQVNIIGNKLVVYFTGKHENIKKQLRAGLYSVILEKTLLGETLSDALKNSLVLDLPKWFSEGYLNYMVDGWDSQTNSDWKSIILNPNNSKRFETLANKYPYLAGKAFWKYMIERHGEKNVKNFIFIAQNENDLNKATVALSGQKLVPTFDSLVNFYNEQYQSEAQNFLDVNNETALISIENDDHEQSITDIKVSPRGSDVAFVTWKHGKFKVNLQKSEKVNGIVKNRISTILDGGYINHNEKPDPEYPILAWSNTGFKLGIMYSKYGYIYLKVYDAVKGKITDNKIAKRKFDRILSFTFMEDDDMIVLSAIKNGQSDIYEYRIKRGKVNQITDDTYDDLNPIYVSGGSRKGIAFLSNRPDPFIDIKPLPNELPAGKMKGYFYNATTKSYDLLALTPNEKGDVAQLIPYGQDNFAFLTNENGISNRNVVLFKRDEANKDVAYSIPVTNGNYSILYQQYHPASKSIADAINTNSGIKVYFREAELPEPFGNLKPVKRTQSLLTEEDFLDNSKKEDLLQGSKQKLNTPEPTNLTRINKDKLVINENGEATFQSKFNKEKEAEPITTITVDSNIVTEKINPATLVNGRIMYVDSTYIQLRSKQYRRSFKPDFYAIRIDNNQLFTRYQNYSGSIATPSLGGMVSASVYDKMEDYRFTGGYRLPVFSDGSAYFAQFDNYKKRVDWGITYFREVKNQIVPIIFSTPSGSFGRYYPIRNAINIIQGYANYPLDKTKSIRLNAAIRQDRSTIKSADIISNLIDNEDKYYISSRAEYVHDDTRMKMYNIPDGLKLKFFGEYLYKIHDDNIFTTSESVRKNSGGFFNVGFDIRNYTQIYKNITFAVRTAFAHSGGNEKVLHVLGGVDNALNAKSANYPIGNNIYAFQSLTTSLRGYDQNSRNGNTYGLISAEVRVPVFETLFRKPPQATIWKYLQAVAFIDAGSAWEGLVPMSTNRTNRAGTFIAPSTGNTPGKIIATIPFEGDDNLAVGYGAGLRTMIFGYFFRADAAWNINSQFRLHLAMGIDF